MLLINNLRQTYHVNGGVLPHSAWGTFGGLLAARLAALCLALGLWYFANVHRYWLAACELSRTVVKFAAAQAIELHSLLWATRQK